MDLESVFLAGPSARQAIRYARRSDCLDLVQDDSLPQNIDRASLASGVPDLATFGIDSTGAKAQVDLWFKDYASRCQRKGVICHVMASTLPADAFVTIRARNLDDDDDGDAPGGCLIHCESPNFTVLRYAAELHRRVKGGRLQDADALILLTTYVMELLGSYAKNPLDPRHGQDAFNLEPVTSRASLMAFLGRMRRYPCVTMARHAAEFAVEGSASRMETVISLVTSLPPRYGGASLGRAELNHALELGEKELALIKHRSIRPDLLWGTYRLIVEYDGRDHHSAPKQKREDKYRIQDYQTLGFTVLPITYEDVSTIGALDRFLMRLVEIIGRVRGRQYVRNKRRQLRDKGIRVKRARLLKFLLA